MKILWIILAVSAGLCVLGGVLVFLIGFVRAFRVQDMFKNEDVESVVARNRDAIRRGCEILECTASVPRTPIPISVLVRCAFWRTAGMC